MEAAGTASAAVVAMAVAVAVAVAAPSIATVGSCLTGDSPSHRSCLSTSERILNAGGVVSTSAFASASSWGL